MMLVDAGKAEIKVDKFMSRDEVNVYLTALSVCTAINKLFV